MEKLFSDSETFTKERPTKITSEHEQEFYREVAEEIIDNKWSDSDVEDIMEDISEISINDNGYEIAKSLEKYNRNAHYDIDIEFCEFLDNLGWRKSDILRKNVQTWVAAHNPQPKFIQGQRLIVEIDLNREKKKGAIVFVTGFNEKEAYYLIDENPDFKGGTIIIYEKVEANCKPLVI